MIKKKLLYTVKSESKQFFKRVFTNGSSANNSDIVEVPHGYTERTHYLFVNKGMGAIRGDLGGLSSPDTLTVYGSSMCLCY